MAQWLTIHHLGTVPVGQTGIDGTLVNYTSLGHCTSRTNWHRWHSDSLYIAWTLYQWDKPASMAPWLTIHHLGTVPAGQTGIDGTVAHYTSLGHCTSGTNGHRWHSGSLYITCEFYHTILLSLSRTGEQPVGPTLPALSYISTHTFINLYMGTHELNCYVNITHRVYRTWVNFSIVDKRDTTHTPRGKHTEDVLM